MAGNVDCRALIEGKKPFIATGVEGMGHDSVARVTRRPDGKVVSIEHITIRVFDGPKLVFLKSPNVIAKEIKYEPDVDLASIESKKTQTLSVHEGIYWFKAFSDKGQEKRDYKTLYEFEGEEAVTIQNCSVPTVRFKETYLGVKDTMADEVWFDRWYSPDLGINVKYVLRRWNDHHLETVTYDVRDLKETSAPSSSGK